MADMTHAALEQAAYELDIAENALLCSSFHNAASRAKQAARAARAAIAADRAQRQPVPVSERLPGPEDCDAEGRCWLCGKVEGDWRLISVTNSGVPKLSYCFSHWLPAHALPLPGEVE